MQQIINMLTSLAKFIFRYKSIYFVAFAFLTFFSAFSSRSENARSFTDNEKDSTGTISVVDEAIKEQLLTEIRKTRFTDSLVAYALELKGKPYRWGGKSPKGFDCSGFVYYIFRNFGHEMERSSRAQGSQGKEVPLEGLQKGDLLFFTGTNPQKKQVGHVGIVSNIADEEIEFVHSSSNGGVKISQLKGYYEGRFLFAKRLLLD
jgi:cell wall-associated NlpC family hydrolase